MCRQDKFAYFANERTGLRLSLNVSRFASLGLYGETGRDRYTPLASIDSQRRDEVTSYGGRLSFTLGPAVSFRLGAGTTEYQSNLPGLDRDITTVDFGLSLRLTREGVGWPP